MNSKSRVPEPQKINIKSLGRIVLMMGIADYVQKYATKDAVEDGEDDSNEEDEMSSVGSYDDEENEENQQDEEPAGQMEEL
jgi:hypothetical protein